MNKLLTVGFVLLSFVATGTDYTWPGTSGGDITDGANWGGSLPTSSDTVNFASVQSVPYCMNLLSAWTLANIYFTESCTLDLGAGKKLSASGLVFFEGGNKTYTLKSGTIESTGNRISMGNRAASNTLVVSGKNSVLKSAPASAGGNSYIGVGWGYGNQKLVVRDGATLDAYLYIGISGNATAGGNSVVITDPGTKWTMTGNRQVRLHAVPDNTLVISNKAEAVVCGVAGVETDEGSIWLGGSDGGVRNRLIVTDGASLRTSQSIAAGVWTSSNEVRIANGGYIGSDGGIQIGRAGNPRPSTGNKLTVSGKGNGLYAKDGMKIGHGVKNGQYWSYGDSLIVEPDAELAYGGSHVVIGNDVQSTSNVVSVAGALNVTNSVITKWYMGANAPFNRFEVLSGGVFTANSVEFLMGHNSTSHHNELMVGPNAAFVCNSYTNVVGEGAANNTMTVNGGRAAFDNNQLIVGLNSSASDNSVVVKDGGTMTVKNTMVTVGQSGPRSRLAVSGGSCLSFTNSNMVVGKDSYARASEVSFEDSTLSLYNDNAGTMNYIQMGPGGGSASNVLRFVRSRFDQTQDNVMLNIAGGANASNRAVGNRVEILDNSVVKAKRFILGDYAKDTRLVISNSVLSVSGQFQPNFKDLTDSGCEVHFCGTNLLMSVNSFNFYGDTKYVFNIPAEGYALTNVQKTVVLMSTAEIREGAKSARAAGKKLIKVTVPAGVRKRGRWTLMRVTDGKYNFAQEGGITVDDIECDPGVTAFVTANTIDVRVSSNLGMSIIVR